MRCAREYVEDNVLVDGCLPSTLPSELIGEHPEIGIFRFGVKARKPKKKRASSGAAPSGEAEGEEAEADDEGWGSVIAQSCRLRRMRSTCSRPRAPRGSGQTRPRTFGCTPRSCCSTRRMRSRRRRRRVTQRRSGSRRARGRQRPMGRPRVRAPRRLRRGVGVERRTARGLQLRSRGAARGRAANRVHPASLVRRVPSAGVRRKRRRRRTASDHPNDDNNIT